MGGMDTRTAGRNGRRQPTVAELAAHDGESITTRKAQHKLGKAAVNKIKLDIFMDSQDNPPEEGVPPTQDDPYGGSENRDMALARMPSSQGPGAHAFFRAAPTDRAREIDPAERIRLRNETSLGCRRAPGARISQTSSR